MSAAQGIGIVTSKARRAALVPRILELRRKDIPIRDIAQTLGVGYQYALRVVNENMTTFERKLIEDRIKSRIMEGNKHSSKADQRHPDLNELAANALRRAWV